MAEGAPTPVHRRTASKRVSRRVEVDHDVVRAVLVEALDAGPDGVEVPDDAAFVLDEHGARFVWDRDDEAEW